MSTDLDKEWKDFGNKLVLHHSLFYKFWQLGKPSFTESIDTAAVVFDKDGNCINFLFNEKFWNECDEYKKLFVICHECLHVVLNHGSRFKDCEQKQIANVAQDIVINHLLVESFGFIQNQIESWDQYCWVETVFKDKKHYGRPYPKDESSEFYYNNLIKECEKDNKNGNDKSKSSRSSISQDGLPQTVDDHSASRSSISQDGLPQTVDDHSTWNKSTQEDEEKILDKVTGGMSPEEMQSISDKLNNQVQKSLKAGSTPLLMPFLIKRPSRVLPKRKWETVIKKWESVIMKVDEHECEQWIRAPRRFGCINTDLFIPSDEYVEDITNKKDKINVFFFMDTSGSCFNLAERFFKAALTLNPKKFNVRLFCFDYYATETSLKSKTLYGGGGTSFKCIEDKIQEIVLKGEKYPHAVFIITDGYGNTVRPQFPKRWHWFLSEKYLNLIPAESHRYMLNDFE